MKTASDFPMYDAQISCYDQEGGGASESLGIIMPGETRSATREFGSSIEGLNMVRQLAFTDAAGLAWTRANRGHLEEVTSRRRANVRVRPCSRWRGSSAHRSRT